MRFRRVWIKKGTLLYHGTGAEEDFEIPDGPAWFSEIEAAVAFFTRWHGAPRPRVLRYIVTQSVQVAYIRTEADLQRFNDAVARATGLDTGGIAELAEATCYTNLSGWLIENNYNPGHDILLCDPDRVLRPY